MAAIFTVICLYRDTSSREESLWKVWTHTHTQRTGACGLKREAAGMCRWCMTCADLTDASHPGDEQLAKEFILHRHLREEVVDFIILSVHSVSVFSDDISKNKTGLWKRRRRMIRLILWKSHLSNIFTVIGCENSPLSHDVEYSVLSRDWDGEYLEIIGSLPKKL